MRVITRRFPLLVRSRLHINNLATAPPNIDKEANYKSRGIVISLCKQGRLREALEVLNTVGIYVDCFTFASLLHGCVKEDGLGEGKIIHAQIIQTGLMKYPDVFLWKTLLNMYAKCGEMESARKVFDQMPERDVVVWTMMISGYAQNGVGDKALEYFSEMKRSGFEPNLFSFASVIPACSEQEDLDQGKLIHGDIIRRGFGHNVFVGNALVDMYAKSGCMEAAYHLFDKMPQRNSVTWNVLVGGCLQNGLVEEALQLFWNMPERNSVSCNAVIAGCGRNGFVEEAQKIFWEMPWRDLVSWTAMIAGRICTEWSW